MALTVRMVIEAATMQPDRQTIAEPDVPAAKDAEYTLNMR